MDPSENLTIIRRGDNRQWKVITLFLTVLNVVLLIVIVVNALKRDNVCDSTDKLILTTTQMKTTSVDELHSNHSTEYITSTPILQPEFYPLYYHPFPLSILEQLPTSTGLSLEHSLYSNVPHASSVDGYLTSVTFRLYTNWEGNDPLYLYALQSYAFALDHITHRYPILPQRNTTQWQTIQIPWRQFPVYKEYHIAVGMQDGSTTNQIVALRSSLSIHGKNITNDTNEIVLESTQNFLGVALIYTILEDDHN